MHTSDDLDTLPAGALEQQIAALAPWFHNLHLPTGVQTVPDHWLGDFPSFKWAQIEPSLPSDLTGWSVLDVGCNAGFYAFELAKRGAQVRAVDVDPRYLRQARWAARQFGLEDRIQFQQMQVYDLARDDDTYDLVWFMGVFYHLRYPLLGLEIVARKTRRLLMFQTLTAPGAAVVMPPENLELADRQLLNKLGWPKMSFIEHRLANDPTNWWAPNHACVEAMLRSCGMQITACPAHETYLCVPAQTTPAAEQDQEYCSALGLAVAATRATAAGRSSDP